MGIVGMILNHAGELYALVKLKIAIRNAEKQVHGEAHWRFCHSLLLKVSRSFALAIQQLGHPEIRDAVCVFYLVLRAIDTVEDDTFISTDVKIPILKAFHHHVYDQNWKFSCGSGIFKVLMDEFHHVRTAFLELNKSYQEEIVNIIERVASGMVKYFHKEVETIDDYNEYCHYVSGLVGMGLSKLFYVSGLENLAPEFLSNSMGLFLQKATIIRDYPEDVKESRFYWPHQIWRKYADKQEDLKSEDNSMNAIHCLNDMVTDALVHVEDCLKYLSAVRDPSIFRFCAIPQIMMIANLTLCYNNIEVFKRVVKMRRGLIAKVFEQTRTMDDVYSAFFDFCFLMNSKVDKDDPNATNTISRLEAIQKICENSVAISRRKPNVIKNEPSSDTASSSSNFHHIGYGFCLLVRKQSKSPLVNEM